MSAHTEAGGAGGGMEDSLMADVLQQQQQQQPPSSSLSPSSVASSSSPSAPSSAPSSLLELRFLLDNSAVGGVIGKGGASVRDVRDHTGVMLSIVKADYRHAQERIMILKGQPQQIAMAAKGITQLLIDAASRREEHPVESAALRLLVHKTGVGAIIGKMGATIKEIQAETGARVQVSNETLPQSSEKTVTVTGTAAQMYAVMLRISTQLLQNPLKPGTRVFMYVPGNAQSFPAPYGAQGMAYPQQAGQAPIHLYAPQTQLHQQPFAGLIRGPGAPTVLSTQKIAIPTICCGSIIGKGGAVIRDLRSQSGTGISISDPDDSTPNERVVTLSGSPQGISHAVFLIRQLVEAYQPNQQPQQQPQQSQVPQQQQQQLQQQQPLY